jgi:hypothetical protein
VPPKRGTGAQDADYRKKQTGCKSSSDNSWVLLLAKIRLCSLQLRTVQMGKHGVPQAVLHYRLGTSRSLQSICKDMNFVIRFGRIGCGGGNHGCEGDFGKEVCCAAER